MKTFNNSHKYSEWLITITRQILIYYLRERRIELSKTKTETCLTPNNSCSKLEVCKSNNYVPYDIVDSPKEIYTYQRKWRLGCMIKNHGLNNRNKIIRYHNIFLKITAGVFQRKRWEWWKWKSSTWKWHDLHVSFSICTKTVRSMIFLFFYHW